MGVLLMWILGALLVAVLGLVSVLVAALFVDDFVRSRDRDRGGRDG